MLNFKSWAVIHAVMIKNASMEIPWWSNDSVLLFQGARVWSLFRELRFHKLRGAVKKQNHLWGYKCHFLEWRDSSVWDF